jgi:hypothetical protein
MCKRALSRSAAVTMCALSSARHMSRLVLVSGYYYPTPRTDVALFPPLALPLVGDLLSYTVAP